MNQIISPLTSRNNVKIFDTIPTAVIIEMYSKIGINVTQFFSGTDMVYILKCLDTGYRFYYPFNIFGDDSFYKNLSTVRKSYYKSRWEHFRAYQNIELNSSVLEIGSGSGIFLKGLKERGIKAKGIELNPHAVSISKKEGLDVDEVLIESHSRNASNKYDVVCCFQVLEHISNVKEFLESCITLLRPGGKLILSVPNNNPYLFINDKFHTLNLPPHHAGLWNRDSLMSLSNLFPIKVNLLEFEPLERSYRAFLKHHITNEGYAISKLIRLSNCFTKRFTRKLITTIVRGRNIFAIYVKESD